MKKLFITVILAFSMSMYAQHNPGAIPIVGVKDIAKSINFYVQVLDFKLKEAIPGPNGGFMHAEVALDTNMIMFSSSKEEANTGMYIYIHHQDVDTLHKNAKKSGANILKAPEDQFYGHRVFSLTDLDGYKLVFWSPIKDFSMLACESCNGPIEKGKYCANCVDDKGQPKDLKTVAEGMTNYYVSLGLDKDIAAKYTQSIINRDQLSPEAVVSAYYRAIKNSDKVKMLSLMTEKCQKHELSWERSFTNAIFSKNWQVIDHEISYTEEQGANAHISVRAVFKTPEKEADNEGMRFRLTKKDGKWWITDLG
ncbi:VOC family protein [Candidatus Uabimicrobium sp. HlEnr_7]|uniref:VOC family protein n=1 Tax=Candidatus Uabimicrobium helgolandensis TaxID=3095367 RepID=UPI003556D8B4